MPKQRSNPLPYVAALAALAACAIAAVHRPAAPAHRPVVRKDVQAEAGETAGAPTAPVRRRVVLVSVDGMSVALVDAMPNIKKMFAEGAGTMKALVPVGHTTAISHAALFTGADPGVNGVDCEPDEPKCMKKYAYEHARYHGSTFRWLPLQVKDTLFTAVEAAGYTPVAAVQKGKLVGMFRQDGDETGILSAEDAGKAVATACEAMKRDKVRLAVLHFKMVDDAGHRDGWLSKRQYEQAKIVDGKLRQVRDCVERANAAGGIRTILIVTADHGGTPGGGHCGRAFDNDDTRLVPWVAVGPGIKRGYEIVGRSDLTPDDAATIQPSILLIDTVPTILHLLGIPASSIPTLSKSARSIDGIHESQTAQ